MLKAFPEEGEGELGRMGKVGGVVTIVAEFVEKDFVNGYVVHIGELLCELVGAIAEEPFAYGVGLGALV